MTSFCLHDDGQHDFSATFNAFGPTNPATGRSLSILAKPGLGSCDPWIVKSCQKVMSWDFWGACELVQNTVKTPRGYCHQSPEMTYCKRFVDIVSTVRNKSLLTISDPVMDLYRVYKAFQYLVKDSMKGNVAPFRDLFCSGIFTFALD